MWIDVKVLKFIGKVLEGTNVRSIGEGILKINTKFSKA